MRSIRGSQRPAMFDFAYLLRDPWGLEAPEERARHEWTIKLILEQFGPIRTLLEIGCGEGMQSRHLLPICEQLTGADVSRRAIIRARERVPEACFVVGNPLSGSSESWAAPFDLAVACEVLYYAKRPDLALCAMSRLAAHCLVTLHEPSSGAAAPYLWRLAGENRSSLSIAGTTWLAAWWSRKPESAPAAVGQREGA